MPIQYFNVNVAVLARTLDEWAAMSDEQLDQHKARALELSRQLDPEGVAAEVPGRISQLDSGRTLASRNVDVEGFRKCGDPSS